MGRFYGTLIKQEKINPSTGQIWNIEDVPVFWKDATIAWLNEN